jgi:hypothetical protein
MLHAVKFLHGFNPYPIPVGQCRFYLFFLKVNLVSFSCMLLNNQWHGPEVCLIIVGYYKGKI